MHSKLRATKITDDEKQISNQEPMFIKADWNKTQQKQLVFNAKS